MKKSLKKIKKFMKMILKNLEKITEGLDGKKKGCH